jgi:hypothetical protein
MNDLHATAPLTAHLARGRRRWLLHAAAAAALAFAGAFAGWLFALVVTGALLARVVEAPFVLAALAVAGALVLVGWFVVRPLLARPSLKALALEAEARYPESRALLVNALELSPLATAPGGNALAAAVVSEANRRAPGLDLAALAPRAVPRRALLVFAGASAAWLLGMLVAPGPLGTSFGRMLDPRAAAATLVTLSVEPGDVTLPPGATLHVRALVEGSGRRPTLVFSHGGKKERVRMEPAEATGRYEAAVRGVAEPGNYQVEVAGVTSPLYAVALAGQAGVVSFDLTYRFPAYTRLPAETQSATRGDVTALEGTVVEYVVNLDRNAKAVRWTLPGGRAAELRALSPKRWTGTFTVGAAGALGLEADIDGKPLAATYRVQPIADQPPMLTVIEPAGDVDLPAGQRIPVWAVVSDDFGVSDLVLVARVEDGPARRVPLAGWPERPREASLGADWDASPLGLLPGRSATFHFELRDNDAVGGPNVTVSRTYTLRFPLLSELFDTMGQQHEETQAALEETKKKAEEVAKQTEALARSLQNERELTWEKKQAAREAAAAQKQVAEAIQKQAEALEQQAATAEERQAYQRQLLDKMQELSKLVSQLQNEEIKRSLEELNQRIEKTDPRQLQQQMKDLAQQQKEMLEGLERSIELMKKIRQEEMAHEAAQRTKELAEKQKALNEQAEKKPADDAARADKLAAEQKRLEAEAEALKQKLAELAKELGKNDPAQAQSNPPSPEKQDPAAEAMQDAAQQMQQEVQPQMDQAAQAHQKSPQNKGQQKQAQQSGQKAQKSLEQMAQQLDQAAQQMTGEDNQAAAEAMRRSAQDLVDLSRAGEQSLARSGADRERAERQEDLKEGAERVIEDLVETGKDTPYLGPQAMQELGRAINALSDSRDAFSQGNPGRGKQAGQQAGEALDKAVIALRESAAACQKPGPNPGGQNGQSAREKMQGLAGQQGEVNGETQQLSERLSQQQRMAAGDQATLERLAGEQRAIRQGLEEALQGARPEDKLLGRMDAAQEEMKQVEEQLRRGNVSDETLARQEKILSRMLDAQRSLNRRDFDDQRESRSGVTVARTPPADLRAALLEREARARYDLLRAQAEKYPGEYRSLVESYLRRLGENE